MRFWFGDSGILYFVIVVFPCYCSHKRWWLYCGIYIVIVHTNVGGCTAVFVLYLFTQTLVVILRYLYCTCSQKRWWLYCGICIVRVHRNVGGYTAVYNCNCSHKRWWLYCGIYIVIVHTNVGGYTAVFVLYLFTQTSVIIDKPLSSCC